MRVCTKENAPQNELDTTKISFLFIPGLTDLSELPGHWEGPGDIHVSLRIETTVRLDQCAPLSELTTVHRQCIHF